MFKFAKEQLFHIGDAHINHLNLTRGTSQWSDKTRCRDFDTIEKMNEAVINSINDTVPKDAILINGGDFLFGDKKRFPEYFNRINCKRHFFLKGNHDDWFDKYPEYKKYFEWFGNYLEYRAGKKLVCVFHYAQRVWRESHHGSYQIYHHSHGTLPSIGRQLDAGWDVWKRPISFLEIDEILSKVPVNLVDHHNRETNP